MLGRGLTSSSGDATALVFCLQWNCTGRSDACCSWFTDRVTEGLGRNGPPVGRTKRLPDIKGSNGGEISEEFWMRKSGEWQAEENQIRASMHGLETVRPERLLDAARILELANYKDT